MRPRSRLPLGSRFTRPLWRSETTSPGGPNAVAQGQHRKALCSRDWVPTNWDPGSLNASPVPVAPRASGGPVAYRKSEMACCRPFLASI